MLRSQPRCAQGPRSPEASICSRVEGSGSKAMAAMVFGARVLKYGLDDPSEVRRGVRLSPVSYGSKYQYDEDAGFLDRRLFICSLGKVFIIQVLGF